MLWVLVILLGLVSAELESAEVAGISAAGIIVGVCVFFCLISCLVSVCAIVIYCGTACGGFILVLIYSAWYSEPIHQAKQRLRDRRRV